VRRGAAFLYSHCESSLLTGRRTVLPRGARGRTTPFVPWVTAWAVRRRGARGVLGVRAVMGKERLGRACPQAAHARGHRGNGATRRGRRRGAAQRKRVGLAMFD
jgi:hypothetical protein